MEDVRNESAVKAAKHNRFDPNLVERSKRGDIDASQQMWIKEAREVIIGERDLIAPKMTPEQIAEAQRMAREWEPKKEK
jgi:hypothetical protein